MNDVVITNTVLTAVFTLLMAFFYFTYKTFPGFGQWTIGEGLFASTCLMIALRGLVPTSLSIVFQNFLFPLAAIFYLSGTRSFLGLPDMSRGWWALPVISGLFSGFSVYFFDSAAWRTLIVAMAYSVPHLATAILVFQDYSKTKSPFSLVLGGEMAIASVILLVWAMWSFTISDFQLLMENPLNKGFFIVLLLLQAVITFSFLMLNVEHSEKNLLSTQDSLRLSEEKFSKAFQSTPDAILITREGDGKIAEVNEAFSAISGYSREEALSHSSVAMNLWANLEDRKKIVTLMRDNKIIRNWEVRFRKKSGELLDCLFSGATFVLNGEEHVLSVVRDITESKRVETALRESESYFRSLTETIPDALVVYDNTGRVTFINRAFEKLYGWSSEELTSQPLVNFVPPSEEAITEQSWERTLRGEKVVLETRRWTKEGKVLDLQLSTAKLENMNGEHLASIVVHRDITDRKRAEEALHESEKRWQFALEGARDGVWDWNAQTNEVFFSMQWKAMLGYEPHEVGNTLEEWDKRVHPDDKKQCYYDLERHFRGETPFYENEHRLLCKDGTYKWILDRGKVMEWTDGKKPLRVIGTHTDITDRKLAEKILKESEAQKQAILDGISSNIAFVNHDLEIQWANKIACASVGKTPSEMIGRTCHSLWADPEKRCDGCPTVKAFETQKSERTIMVTPDGRVWDEKGEPVFDTTGNLIGVVEIAQDITDQVDAEREKETLRSQLFQSQKMEALGTLVGGIAHDFNNMLQIMIGYSQLLLDAKKKGEPGYKELQIIIETGHGGAELVKKLLAFGQQGQVFPVLLDLNQEVSQLKTLISHTLPQLVQVDLDLVNGPTNIRADHAQIEQLIMNLSINASEAMPNGGRLKIGTKTVSLNDEYCRSHPGVKSGSYVMLSVTDSGRGMDEETLSRAFDPFFSTKERGSIRGTGLGLSVVKGIVQQQGGHVTCESEPGKGTTFKVYFPAIEGPVMTAKTLVATVQSGGAETILVVEDNIPVAELEQTVLENAGYTVIVATNGREALEIYRTKKDEILLVILDLLMPEMSGRDCLMELLKINPSVKVLIASGYAPEDDLQKEISPLVKGFVHKPFAMTELLSEARAVLGSERDGALMTSRRSQG